jgi:L-arabinose transport system substrate-binding protein
MKLRSSRARAVAIAGAGALASCGVAAWFAVAAAAHVQRPAAGTQVALIQRFQGGTSFFQDVAKGAKAEAGKVGIDLSVQFTNSSDEQLTAIDSAIASGVKGIILNIQDPTLGPAIAKKARAANVALLASDDAFKDENGNSVPVVTLDAKKGGALVGKLAATLFKKAKWHPGRGVRVASIELPSVQTCNDRTSGARKAFLAAVRGFSAKNVLRLSYDGTLNSGNTVMAAAIANNRSVKQWVVWSCNDEGMVGATKALANAGWGPSKVIGIGLGANLSCNAWRGSKPSSYKGAVVLDPKVNGKSDVDVMNAFLAKGTPMPATTIFPMSLATRSTYTTNRAVLPC